MSDTLFIRKGKSITLTPAAKRLNDEENAELTGSKHHSINAAKRRSRELQMEHDGALGRGSVMRG